MSRIANKLPDVLDWPIHPGPHGTAPPVFAMLRASNQAHRLRMPSGDLYWLFVSKDDIASIITDPRFSREPGDLTRRCPLSATDVESQPTQHGATFSADPLTHARVRQILEPHHTPELMEATSAWLTETVDEQLAAMEAGPNPTDLVDAYALPLAVHASGRLLGIPSALRRAHFDTLLATVFRDPDTADTTPDVSSTDVLVALARECLDACDRAGPNATAALARARADDVLSDDQAVEAMVALLVSGSAPIAGPLSVMTLTLLRHHRQLTLLRNDPDRWPAAVSELLRYHQNGPVSVSRVALEDVEVGRTLVRKGEAVVTPYLAGLWDPKHHQRPDQFDIRRAFNDVDLAFGGGQHYCLGSTFTPIYLHIALQRLIDRFPQIALACHAEDIPWHAPESFFTRPRHMPITW